MFSSDEGHENMITHVDYIYNLTNYSFYKCYYNLYQECYRKMSEIGSLSASLLH